MQVIHIAGASHSGSTLLNMMLNAHPQIVSRSVSCTTQQDRHSRRIDCPCGDPSLGLCEFWSGMSQNGGFADPMADARLAKHEYGIDLIKDLREGPFDAVILAVKHELIARMGETGIRALLAPGGLIYDLKGILPPTITTPAFNRQCPPP